MEVRYTTDPEGYKRMTTEELRKMFLIEDLFKAGEVKLVYTDTDRAILGSAVPVNEPLQLLASKKEMAAEYFTERREAGIFNIGGAGKVKAGGQVFDLVKYDCLYIGKGTKTIEFLSDNPDEPAQFYIISYPAAAEYPTTLVKYTDVEPLKLGSSETLNKRRLHKYIYPDRVKSNQLVMGYTTLEEGSGWNTMPSHTHQRRTEIYLYFDIQQDALVFHFMGEPEETRHLIVKDKQATISPSYSIHTGAGTRNYSFIWAMGGENQAFDDMDGIPIEEMR
jgi:4-deoxy-L-threo-5-hexosulose-uronate ketol-isomerase